jgi:hypothetical protein
VAGASSAQAADRREVGLGVKIAEMRRKNRQHAEPDLAVDVTREEPEDPRRWITNLKMARKFGGQRVRPRNRPEKEEKVR